MSVTGKRKDVFCEYNDPKRERITVDDYQEQCVEAMEFLNGFYEFMKRVSVYTFAQIPAIQKHFDVAIALIDVYRVAKDTQQQRQQQNPDQDVPLELPYYTENELLSLRIAELHVFKCIIPQMNRVVDTPKFGRLLFLNQMTSDEIQRNIVEIHQTMIEKLNWWRGRECIKLLAYLKRRSHIVVRANIALESMTYIIRDRIMSNEVVDLLKDLWLCEKYARAVLMKRMIELQRMISNACSTYWLRALDAEGADLRSENRENIRALLHGAYRHASVNPAGHVFDLDANIVIDTMDKCMASAAETATMNLPCDECTTSV